LTYERDNCDFIIAIDGVSPATTSKCDLLKVKVKAGSNVNRTGAIKTRDYRGALSQKIKGEEQMFKSCPKCGGSITDQTKLCLICVNCGRLTKTALASELMELTLTWAGKVVKEELFTPIEQGEDQGTVRQARNGEFVYNTVNQKGEVKNKFPSLFFPSDLEEPVVLIDKPFFLSDNHVVFYYIDFLPTWAYRFYKKEVILVSTDDEVKTAEAGRILTQGGAVVYFSKMHDTVERIIENVKPVGLGDKHETLRDLYMFYHSKITRSGRKYTSSINHPLGDLVNEVIAWFREKNGIFLWDVENNQGYLKWRNHLYLLHPSNPELKDMLRVEGGIISSTVSGRAIIEGLCSAVSDAKKIIPEPWIKGFPSKNEIRIKQGEECIYLMPERIEIKEDSSLSYDILRRGRKWFTPIQLNLSGGGLEAVFPEIFNYFAVAPVAREMIFSWLFAIFLKDYASIRPGIRISGKWSTGKSTILQMCFWLFYGVEGIELTAEFTDSALWRWATTEPFLPIDNRNVKSIHDSLNTFIDVCATGGQRLLSTPGTALDFSAQKTHSFIMMSGLDEFMAGDVRSRYFEFTTDESYKSVLQLSKRKEAIFKWRDKIFSEIFDIIVRDILPNIEYYTSEELHIKCTEALGTKHRTAEYFVLMLAIGEALQKREVIPRGDLLKRWAEHINVNCERANIINAETIEWMKMLQTAVTKTKLTMGFSTNSDLVPFPCDIITGKDDRAIGVKGTIEELLSALNWVATYYRRKIPYENSRELRLALIEDLDALLAKGFIVEFDKEKERVVVKWNL